MQTSRRAFLAWIPASLYAASVAASPKLLQAAPPTDAEHAIGAWRVKWSGWKEAPNQVIQFGYWFAYQEAPEAQDGHITLCTTLGRLQRVPYFGVIDLSWGDEAPRYMPFGADAERAKEAAYRAAYATLVDALRRARC